MNSEKELSLVIPLLNEEGNIAKLYDELIAVLKNCTIDYEIIFVDDGSTDKSFPIIKEIASKNNKVKGISLSRNFGHQVALYAGLYKSSGKKVIMMDADLQHPPALLPKLLEESEKGYDIVNTRRLDTKDAGIFKKFTSKFFYKLINYMSNIHIEASSSDFRLMTRKAVEAFLTIEERDRFTRGLISWMGFKQSIIDYNAPPRHSGKSKYTVRKMFRFATDGITSFSAKPLRISFTVGLFVLFFALIYSTLIIIKYINGETITGWASTMLIVLFLGSFQLLSIGIIGEYLARIFNESKSRPIFFIGDETNNSEDVH